MLPALHRLFKKVFKQHLFITNTFSCGALLGFGDFVQQNIERSYVLNKKHDWKRTCRMFTIGFALGPMTHVWYGFLDKLYPKVTGRNVFRKVILDQLIGAPTFSFTFITGMCYLEGRAFSKGITEFKEKFPTIYLVDWFVWPPCQVINFFFMPHHFRAMFVYIVDCIWYTFNSYIKHRDQHEHIHRTHIMEKYDDISPRLIDR